VENSLEQLVVSTFGIELFLGYAALGFATLTWEPVTTRLGLERGRLPISLVLLAALGTMGLSHAIDCLLSMSGLRAESVLAELDANLYGASGRELLLAIFGLGIAPGIGEELLCRGFLQRGLVRRYGAVVGIGIGALVFGAMHLEWIQGTAAVLLGLYLGTVAFFAGSIRPAIFCHCCNNLAALAIGVSGQGGDPTVASIALGLAAATVGIGSLLLHQRRA
jgi:membrane protease YdiL (CAAX protease family)